MKNEYLIAIISFMIGMLAGLYVTFFYITTICPTTGNETVNLNRINNNEVVIEFSR
jgi:hypothetical protein